MEGYAKLRVLKQQRVQSTDLETDNDVPIIWDESLGYAAKARSLDFAQADVPLSTKAR